MKETLSLLLAMIIGIKGFAQPAPPETNVVTSVRFAHNFSLSIEHHPSTDSTEEIFLITLTNVSSNDLIVCTSTNLFHGDITVEVGGKKYEAMQKDYRALLKSYFKDPHTNLPKGENMQWSVAISELATTARGYEHIFQNLAGTTVYAELHRLAVVPESKSYFVGNAASKSNELKIESANKPSPPYQ